MNTDNSYLPVIFLFQITPKPFNTCETLIPDFT